MSKKVPTKTIAVNFTCFYLYKIFSEFILAISHEFDLNDNNAWPAGAVCALPGNIKILDGVYESECECYTSFLASGVYLRKTNHCMY